MSSVHRDRHERASEIFAEASDLPPERRAEFLGRLCGEDQGLRAEVETLLECDSRAGEFLAGTAHENLGLDPPPSGTGLEHPPEHVGPYRVLTVLGEGGMGVVYEAEQTSPQRRVALKVLREELATPGARRRFEFEAEVLGRLQHPGIARIFEAGTAATPHGPRPYFAMELVRGRPLLEYARVVRPGIRARLRLFVKICSAIEHAHQKGVVHRDLKPGNILVDEEDEPHVLDFGVARTVDHAGRRETWRTGEGQLLGTLPYMSPEQVSDDHDAVDTRSDVYALGVILFELLTGRLPYDLASATFPQALLAITEGAPTSLGSVDRRFSGDLDTIVAKALSKERERRYSSASDLAADVRRHLDDEPIVARPASTLYHLQKFAKRNKALVGALLLTFMALLVGFVSSNVSLQRARTAERRSSESLSEMERFSDQLLADELIADAAGLFPCVPERMQGFVLWLDRADELLARVLDHRDFRGRLREQAAAESHPPGVRGDVVQRRWRLELAERTCQRLAELEQLASQVAASLAEARDVVRLMQVYRDEWAAARAAIAASPAYQGLDLPPQMGLIPLGENRTSGLWEFWDASTGEPPVSTSDGERWILERDTGLVFVLLPAGRFRMGVVPGDGFALPREGPAHWVELDPFLLSKYEVTQGQWLRWTGENPSVLHPDDRSFPEPIGYTHPVENMTWYECQEVLARLGLVLSTESQWEYACRAGTTTVWWTGDELRSLSLAENLADEGYDDDYVWSGHAELWDGFRGTAPVGSLRPNPFGLFDMHGNVAEWVRDLKTPYDSVAPVGGEGQRPEYDSDYGIRRGAGYRFRSAEQSRSSARASAPRDNRSSLTGVRPARRLLP